MALHAVRVQSAMKRQKLWIGMRSKPVNPKTFSPLVLNLGPLTLSTPPLNPSHTVSYEVQNLDPKTPALKLSESAAFNP